MTTRRRAGICLGLLMTLAGVVAAHGIGGNDKQFQAALQKEMAGDWAAAIETYRAVSTRPGVNRELAAMALIRMAGCYEKLGAAEARAIYTQVVRDFSDQRTQVLEAQTRLDALAPAAPLAGDGASQSPIPLRKAPDWDRRMTSDGRYGIFERHLYRSQGHLSNTYNIGLFEYATGKTTWITNFPDDGADVQAETLVVSPDGSRVACTVARRQAETIEVAVAPIGETPTPKVIYKVSDPDGLALIPNDNPIGLAAWTPDNVLIGVRVLPSRWREFFKLDVATGEMTQILTEPWLYGTNMWVSPDGRTIAFVRIVDGNRELYTVTTDGRKVTRLTDSPGHDPVTCCGNVIWSRDGRHLLFASDRQGSESLWAVQVEDGAPVGEFPVLPGFSGDDLQWAGDRLSYIERSFANALFGTRLDGANANGVASLSRLRYSEPCAAVNCRDEHPAWGRRGEFVFVATGDQDTAPRLVIQRPDGTTRERALPEHWGRIQEIVGFNVEGTAVASYANGQQDAMALYDLGTDAFTIVLVPAVPAGWAKRLGFAVVQGGPGDYVIYHPVTKQDQDTASLNRMGEAFEIHRLDAAGQDRTVYRSGATLGAGGRPLWLSSDGTALRFVEGRMYRELDLATGQAVDLLPIGDDIATSRSSFGPVSSADGRTVAVRLAADDFTFRVMDLVAGTSKDVTVRMADLWALMEDQIPGGTLSIDQFRLSPTGDLMAFQVEGSLVTRRYVTEDPLARYLRNAGGR